MKKDTLPRIANFLSSSNRLVSFIIRVISNFSKFISGSGSWLNFDFISSWYILKRGETTVAQCILRIANISQRDEGKNERTHLGITVAHNV